MVYELHGLVDIAFNQEDPPKTSVAFSRACELVHVGKRRDGVGFQWRRGAALPEGVL